MNDKVKISPKINRGLKGVYFERSGVSDIDGAAGTLSYRGYSIDDLATKSTFEEVSYLLIYGDLPNAQDLATFDAALKAARTLPPQITDIVTACKGGHPMDVLRTCVSALAAMEPDSRTLGESAFIANGIRLISQVPMIIATHEALRNNRIPVAPDPTLSHAANWLWMLKGEKPSASAARLADVDFILHAEHGSNASSFAARVTIATEANLHGAIVTALSTLAGPAHGGAAEDVMKMVQEIGTPEKAAAYVTAKRKNREAVTGFGHRVYRREDPRAAYARWGSSAGRRNGRATMVRDPASGSSCDAAVRASRVERECRFLFRGNLPVAWRAHGPLRADLCHWPHARLGNPVHRATKAQHSDPPSDAVRRTGTSGIPGD
jgi:citrate synthase